MTDTQPTVTSYSDALDILAGNVRMALDLAPGLTIYSVVDRIAAHTVENATLASTRGGHWATESTPAQIEDALFMGTVASDVLDGTVARPSIGNVRNALIHRAARA